MRQFDVSDRTIARDINVLRKAGFEIESSSRGYHCKIPAGNGFSHLRNSDIGELVILASFLRAARALPFAHTASEALFKVLSKFTHIESTVHFRGTSYDSNSVVHGDSTRVSSVFKELSSAISERQMCMAEVMTNHPADHQLDRRAEVVKICFLPAILECDFGHWIIRGVRGQGQDIVEIEIDRIQRVLRKEVASAELIRRADLSSQLSRSRIRSSRQTVRVVLHINSDAPASIQEIEWERGQAAHRLRNGTLEISFHAPISEGLISRVIVHMKHVSVIEPPELRGRLDQVGEQLLAKYGGGGQLSLHRPTPTFRLAARRRATPGAGAHEGVR